MPDKVAVSLDTLCGLAEIARRNGTTSAFIDMALQWVSAADAEIQRLRKLLDEEKGDVAPTSGMDALPVINVWEALVNLPRGDHYLRTLHAFQTAHGLVPDGFIGPLTWAALFEMMEKEGAEAPPNDHSE